MYRTPAKSPHGRVREVKSLNFRLMLQVKSLDKIGIYTYCYLFVDSFKNRKRELFLTANYWSCF